MGLLTAVLAIVTSVPSLNAQRPPPAARTEGRFTAVFYPSEATLVRSLLDYAVRTDTFPGLPRPTERVLLAVAPDERRFRQWAGPSAPEWGAAVTFPESHRIVMQGRSAGTRDGDPREILRHELAHLALHEYLGDLPPRWFDEGYASYSAHEWTREDALAANLALVVKGVPTFEELDEYFNAGATSAQSAYALSYRAVVDFAAMDTTRGLARLFQNWKALGSLDRAVRASYGMTLAGFETDWQRRTRRRYGALALAGDLTLGGLVMLVVILPLYYARRRRDRVRLAAMREADEAAERAARESYLEALLAGDDGPDFGDERPRTGAPDGAG